MRDDIVDDIIALLCYAYAENVILITRVQQDSARPPQACRGFKRVASRR